MEKQDRFEILLEDINSKFELVLEGHNSLRQEFGREFEKLNKRIDDVDFKVDVVNNRLNEVDAKLSKRIDEVDAKLSRKIDAVAADLAAHRADTELHRAHG
ncbi:hypothetical protein LGV61_02480 [Desulfurispirillum indicum]|uniref:hypothetical protein n=1 Tax=Desulfurispirillum indicum TaxID=936456 RepID=UPI001CFADAE2|nr:hypothetical protein [Desulfurispirillum indicum]UCZ57163.1 hypothetical protein LGV61_02480 [Desulfurispirillum indicum]